MGSQVKRYDKNVRLSMFVDDPNALARGNNRYLLCECGWLVQLTAAGRANSLEFGALPGGPGSLRHRKSQRYQHVASSACTNYLCTGRAGHRRKRTDHYKTQVERHKAIRAGEAHLVVVTNDGPARTARA